MKRLIINADDFGLTAGVNRAITELHRQKALTSATLMARATATDEAVAMADPSLGVGCHVVLVDGQSVLAPRRDLVLLVDPVSTGGRFKPTLLGLLRLLYLQRKSRSFSNRRLEEEIQAEAAAQISLLQGHGFNLTHIDTHKHTHMFPRVLRPVLRAARAAGIRTIRNPFEPEWSIRATPRAPWLRRIQVQLLRTFEPIFRRIVAEEGFVTTDGAIGVLATGTLDPATLASLLRAVPHGTWELVTHPGYNDAELAQAGTRLLASREIELAALSAASFAPDIELIHFGHLMHRNSS
ncbi:ChbG/HpnK family deacetylase [Acidicapsa acidisoli]|uniref:ChbG/HpnK family deacetylase n=1 Tax=Acidicapsa acidisoli TaxID=1615681 RepID=UPI0021E0C20A|nr:ChbG/HpnK family deacetylase [Acidicapsa acidisoli]